MFDQVEKSYIVYANFIDEGWSPAFISIQDPREMTEDTEGGVHGVEVTIYNKWKNIKDEFDAKDLMVIEASVKRNI